LEEYQTCFRLFGFLEKDEFVEFMKYYYGLEAIDLAMMKVSATTVDSIQIYQLFGDDGRMQTNEQVAQNMLPNLRPVAGPNKRKA
jgi:hypothetical protein